MRNDGSNVRDGFLTAKNKKRRNYHMMGSMQVRIFDGVLPFSCPLCQYRREIPVESSWRKGRVRCKCNAEFVYHIERRVSRRYPYKIWDLALLIKPKGGYYVRIEDMSFGGIGFHMDAAEQMFDIGQEIQLEYHLTKNVRCTHTFIVRNIRGDHVGIQYCDGKNYTPMQRRLMH